MSENANGAGDGGNGNGNGDGGEGAGQQQGGAGGEGQSGKEGQGQQGAGEGGQQQGKAGDGKSGAGQQQAKGGEGEGGEGEGSKGYWPEDWRKNIAGDDVKLMKRLERYATPKDVSAALIAAQDKISKGQVKTALKEGATAEEIKAWRAENGIPETAEGYDVSLGDGHVWGEADKPLVDSFAKAAHDANLPPDKVKPLLKWYEGLQEKQAEARQLADAQFKKENVDELREEYGATYRAEIRIIDEFFEALPDGLGEVLMNARDASGRPLGANAKLLRWANTMQREANPAGVVLPGSGVNSMQALESELTTLKSLMRDKQSKYWKGPEADKLQTRYRELLDAKDRSNKKAA